ncbi:phosphotransferase-like protein [Streptomyces sp. IBSNAI002]|uniref:phosphotransferase-like protein n=1 Tax=Streptomyces sp. IBSNAI002 TaxID=3457500 RepID=UPI003FD62591
MRFVPCAGPARLVGRCQGRERGGRVPGRRTGDRTPGMAVAQADVVHEGVVSDLEVDTAHTESLVCARTVAGHVS